MREWSQTKRHRPAIIAALFGGWLSVAAVVLQADDNSAELKQQMHALQRASPVAFGVYAKNLSTGEQLEYQSDRSWYLASLVKVPLAIAVLQAVERNQLSLADHIVLQESDYVDGSGNLLSAKPGTRFTIGELLQQSLEHSDSTATDILMRKLGVDAFNNSIKNIQVSGGIAPLTTIIQVRYDAYQQLHPHAAKLSNMDYVEIRSAGDSAARVQAFRRKLGLTQEQLLVATLEDAFAHYYQSGLNSGTLKALGAMLERLAKGELLNTDNTHRLLHHMQSITTGANRLSAGLPSGTPFAQKTGTQIDRACNMGIAHPQNEEKALVIVMCSEGDIEQAEKVFEQVAAILSRSTLYPRQGKSSKPNGDAY